jgi:hypothetical protein
VGYVLIVLRLIVEGVVEVTVLEVFCIVLLIITLWDIVARGPVAGERRPQPQPGPQPGWLCAAVACGHSHSVYFTSNKSRTRGLLQPSYCVWDLDRRKKYEALV